MKSNIKEIARLAEVSIATVSRVINNQGPVRETTRKNILRIAGELDYIPNHSARGLSRKKTDTIGVILPELHDEFFMDIVHAIDEEAHRHKQYLMISSSHSQRNEAEIMVEFMSGGRVDGVILMAPSLRNEIKNILSKSKSPIVLLNCDTDMEGVVSFGIDNLRGAYSAVEHLIGHGYKKIAMVQGPEQNSDAEARYHGYQTALQQSSITLNPSMVVRGDFSFRSGYYGFTRLMGQEDKPEAIFCANDMMALGAYEAARNSNITIPDDVAIVGFDDIFPGRVAAPRLTTVHTPIMELGIEAVNYLLKMISGKVDSATSFKKTLTTGLIARESCGCKSFKQNI